MIELSPRQKRFAAEYVKDGNATRAYEAAYGDVKTAGVNACNLLKKPNIHDYIKKLQESIIGELSADAVEVREYFTSVMRGEEEIEDIQTIVVDKEVQQVSIKRAPSHSERIRAAEYLAKSLGMFVDKVKMDVTSAGKPVGPMIVMPDKGNNRPKDTAATTEKAADEAGDASAGNRPVEGAAQVPTAGRKISTQSASRAAVKAAKKKAVKKKGARHGRN